MKILISKLVGLLQNLLAKLVSQETSINSLDLEQSKNNIAIRTIHPGLQEYSSSNYSKTRSSMSGSQHGSVGKILIKQPQTYSLPINSLETLNMFLANNKNLYYWYVILQLKRAIPDNEISATLFRVGQTPLIAKIHKNQYEMFLEEAKRFYISIDEFERAQVCQTLLDQHRVNLFIDSEKDYGEI